MAEQASAPRSLAHNSHHAPTLLHYEAAKTPQAHARLPMAGNQVRSVRLVGESRCFAAEALGRIVVGGGVWDLV